MIKATELREKTSEELTETLLTLTREHFNLRTQKALGQSPKPHLFRRTKKDIARVKTVIHEKRLKDKA